MKHNFINKINVLWQIWGFNHKADAISHMKLHFTEGIDYVTEYFFDTESRRRLPQYFVTNDCADKMSQVNQRSEIQKPESNSNIFTVDLNDQWKDWGYSRKDSAVKYIIRNFTEDLDYITRSANGEASHGGQNIIEYMLTEKCAFEMAKSIQTKAALDFKNDKLAQIANLSGTELSLIAIKKLSDENCSLSHTNSDLARSLEENSYKVKAFDNLINSDGTYSMKDVADILEIGRTHLFRILKRDGILIQTGRTPYKKYLDLGYFVVKVKIANGRSHSVTRVTPKGLAWLMKKYKHPTDHIKALTL